ncbi:MAG: alanine racemase [Firmicutes bacterium]|nr:alanine racemase [Bacillota bacterium]
MKYRNTYVKVSLKNITSNVSKMIQKYHDYQYYFGVVKADSYGHYGNETVRAIIKGGCNYLAVSSLEEALKIRVEEPTIPILCLGIIPPSYLKIAEENNITITVTSLNYLKELTKTSFQKLKIHLKLNTGMNRLGFKEKQELNEAYQLIKQCEGIVLEGIYTHIYEATSLKNTEKQFSEFEELCAQINLNSIPIVHITASDATALYPKCSYVNGCRFGIMMYGFSKDPDLQLDSTFQLRSEIIQIQTLRKGETVGYDGIYQATEEKERIGVVSIGYADGIVRANCGRTVTINHKKYPIVGNICMDMLFVKIDDTIKEHDEVILIKDVEDVKRIAKYLNTVEHEVLCSIGKRVPRIYE